MRSKEWDARERGTSLALPLLTKSYSLAAVLTAMDTPVVRITETIECLVRTSVDEGS